MTKRKTAKIGAATRTTALPAGAVELPVRDWDLTDFAARVRKDSCR